MRRTIGLVSKKSYQPFGFLRELDSLIEGGKSPTLAEDRDSKMSMFTGDPVEDMEIAKRLIGQYPDVDFRSLMAIASDQRQPQSARIAAIYTLGFTDEQRLSRAALTQISGDPREPADVRDFATEALESLTDTH